MPTIGLVVSTMNNGIFRVPDMLPEGLDAVTVVHQVTGQHAHTSYDAIYHALNSRRVQIIVQPFGGLSKSRNAGMAATDAEYLLITDDDVTFPEHLQEILLKAITSLHTADIITFQIQTPDGNLFKNYPAALRRHSKRSVARVSSIEMLIRKKWLVASEIQFDTTFGLGAIFPTGEEFIFLRDGLQKGAHAYFYPANIATHAAFSSGKNLDAAQLINKGAMITRVYGRMAFFVMCAFALKKHAQYKASFSFLHAMRYLNSGRIKFLHHG